jgi:hypothetical protein
MNGGSGTNGGMEFGSGPEFTWSRIFTNVFVSVVNAVGGVMVVDSSGSSSGLDMVPIRTRFT